ncbi:hypothetical protein VNO77_27107 [Canavalia gladiata]|uniref:Uncharacterized protein n=1 Tax=Canavalia gladiata TaxID=3824 RepID=A0AAN9KTF2_CANGL
MLNRKRSSSKNEFHSKPTRSSVDSTVSLIAIDIARTHHTCRFSTTSRISHPGLDCLISIDCDLACVINITSSFKLQFIYTACSAASASSGCNIFVAIRMSSNQVYRGISLQIFSGGQASLADHCTYFVARSDGPGTDTNNARAPDRMLGEVRGSNSRCMAPSLVRTGLVQGSIGKWLISA